MNSETRQCQNCKQNFVIDPEDFAFYERIKVPPPTWCPECRRVRRFQWRNERNLYKHVDMKNGKLIFSQFSPTSKLNVYERDFWWSDQWDPFDYAQEVDFSKPFFTQFGELMNNVPFMSRFLVGNSVNSDYCMNAGDLRNCYLVFATTAAENTMYSVTATYCKDSMDLYSCFQSELCYQSVFCTKCYATHFSLNCESCQNIWFSRDCVGCTNCIGCSNLRDKSHCIFNEQFSKEGYFRELEKLGLGSFAFLEQLKRLAYQKWNLSPWKFIVGFQNSSVTGNYVFNSKNTTDSYRVWGAEDCKHCNDLVTPISKDVQDVNSYGRNLELSYEGCTIGWNCSHLRFCWWCDIGDTDLEYCMSCHSSSHLFGCIGLRNKQYCILNKQYTKEEYEKLVPKIIQHMNDMPYVDKKGRIYKYGEFFPPELSPFAYNETIAQEYFPLTKDQALAQGYSWKDPEERNYQITKKTADLPDHIKDVPDSITQEIIQCAHTKNYRGSTSIDCNEQCTTAFKIIPEELAFYRRMNLPLPRLCPNCRHYQRLKQRNPLKLWHRKCQCAGNKSENSIYTNTISHFHKDNHCPNEFETSYAPERKEIVYCEQCYNAEVV